MKFEEFENETEETRLSLNLDLSKNLLNEEFDTDNLLIRQQEIEKAELNLAIKQLQKYIFKEKNSEKAKESVKNPNPSKWGHGIEEIEGQ